MFILVTAVGWHYAGEATDWLYSLIGLEAADLGDLGFIKKVVHFTIALVLRLAVLVAYMATFKYIVLVLLAPVLAYLSEKTDELLTGEQYPFNAVQLFKDAVRGMIIAIRNGIIEFMIMVVLFLASFIPVVGFLAGIAGFFVESYFYGFSMIDYYCERKKMPVTVAGRYIWKYKGIATANGLIFNGILLACTLLAGLFPFVAATVLKVLFIIPIIGLSVLPVYSVVAAMIAIKDAEKASDEARIV